MKTNACNYASTSCTTRSKPHQAGAARRRDTGATFRNEADFGALANILLCYVIGRWQQYAKSGFTREPMAKWAQQWPMLYVTCLSQRSDCKGRIVPAQQTDLDGERADQPFSQPAASSA
jgi:hypothetical protein